jgi:hypothetical protein
LERLDEFFFLLPDVGHNLEILSVGVPFLEPSDMRLLPCSTLFYCSKDQGPAFEVLDQL